MVKNKIQTNLKSLIILIFVFLLYNSFAYAININACTNLSTSGGSYALTQNVNSSATCIDIRADNIILDCQGYTMTGNGTSTSNQGYFYGINITKRKNITVRNCTITNYTRGIYLNDTNLSFFSNLTIFNNTDQGIYLLRSNNNTFNHSNISYNSARGVYFDGAHYNFFYNNTFYNGNNGNQIDINFNMGSSGKSNGTVFTGNIFTDATGFNGMQNANNASFNNSNYGNRWTAKDTPAETCYDTNVDGICDEIYNSTVASGGGGGGDSEFIDYLPIRSQSIAAGITVSLSTSNGTGQYNDTNFHGYVAINDNGTYDIDVIHNQASTDNVTITLTNYNSLNTLTANQTGFMNVGAYSRITFKLNVSDSTNGTYFVGINATCNGSNNISFLNLSTSVIEAFAASSTWQTNLVAAETPAIGSADFLKDGNPDVIIVGDDGSSNPLMNIYTSDGTTLNKNTTWSQNLINVSTPSIALADFDNDNDTDMIIAGFNTSSASTRIYINNGTSFNENLSWQQNITPVQNAAIVQGDIDLDGDVDLVIIGQENNSNDSSKVYINNGTTFNENSSWEENLTRSSDGTAQLIDINNDDYLDLVIITTTITQVYTNNKTAFLFNTTYSNGLRFYQSGNDHPYMASADFNNDGWMDIVVSGQVSGSFGLDVYFNNKTSFYYNSSWVTGFSTSGEVAIYPGDYNNDGKIDLILVSSGNTGESVLVYNNTGKVFTSDTTYAKFLPSNTGVGGMGIQKGSPLLVDINGNNDLDLIIAGDDSGAVSKVYTNNRISSNNAPTAPSVFNYNVTTGLNLSWSGASDTQGGTLYYNIRVGTASGGNDIISSEYGTGNSPSQGMYGNMHNNTQVLLNQSDRTYYWAVQTIDSSLKRSAWSAEQTYEFDTSTNINNCQNLNTAGGNYKLTQNVTNASTCFHISADNIRLDCQGYNLTGNGTSSSSGGYFYGINISGRKNITIENCTISNFTIGVYLNGTNLSFLSNLTIINNTDQGIYLLRSHNNTFNHSNISKNQVRGVRFDGSHDNFFYNNTFNNVDNSGSQIDFNFNMGPDGVSNGTVFTGNTFVSSGSFTGTQNANNLTFNNSNYGNRWTAKDTPIEGCYDANANGICDNIYNSSEESVGGGGGEEFIDYLPIRSTSITAGISLSLSTSRGSGRFNDSTFHGYVGVNTTGNYYIDIINSQASSDNMTITLTNYHSLDNLTTNVSSIQGVSPYSKTTFKLNVSDSSTGTFYAGINVTCNGSNNISFLNLSSSIIEAFSTNASWHANLLGVQTPAIAVGDFLKDGNFDLIILGDNGTAPLANVYASNGNTFNKNTTWNENITNVTTPSIALGDFDNDNDTDIIIAGDDGRGSSTKIYINNGTTFKENFTWQENITQVKDAAIVQGDIDLDGDIDLVIIGQENNSNSSSKVYTNNGTTFSESLPWQNNLTRTTDGTAHLIDINNDDYLDLVIITTTTAQVYTNNKTEFKLNTTYSFGLRLYQSGNTHPFSAVADFNNDGWMDLAVSGQFSGSYGLDIYFNNKTSFYYNSSWITDLTATGELAIYPGDYNNNGKVDLVLVPGGTTADSVLLYNNTGSRFIQDNISGKILPTSGSSGTVQKGSGLLTDLDGDNNLDLILVGDQVRDNSTIYINPITSDNNIPNAPITFSSNHTTGLNLSWSGASDTQGGTLYYNLRVGNSSGANNIVSGEYGTSNSPPQGMFGNMLNNTNILLNISNQTYYWAVQTIDSSLKASTWSTEQIYPVSSPVVVLNYPENNFNTTVTSLEFNLTVTDDGTVSNCSLYTNFTGTWQLNKTVSSPTKSALTNITLNNLPQGRFIWNVLCVDSNSNSAWNNSNKTITFDRANPTVTLVTPPNNTLNTTSQSINFYFNVTDALSSIKNCTLILNKTINVTNTTINKAVSSIPFSQTLPNGIHNWSVNCTDFAGNVDNSDIYNLTVNVTNTPPTVNLTSPVNNYNTSQTSISFNCTSTDNTNLTNISFYTNTTGSWLLNATGNVTGTSNSTNITISALTVGTYKWGCLAYDQNSEGNWSSSNYTLTVETTAPTVTLIRPTNNTKNTSNRNIKFFYNVTDGLNIDNCSLIINNSVNQTNSSINKSIANLTFIQSLANADYNWSVNCSDNAGNIGASTTYNITVDVDQTAPIVRLTSPVNNYNTSNYSVNLNCSLTDNKNLTNVSFYTNSTGSWALNYTATITGTSNSTNRTLDILKNGTFIWNCLAYDNAGNSAFNSTNYTFIIENTPPIFNFTISDRYVQTSTAVIATVNATDLKTSITTVVVEGTTLNKSINSTWNGTITLGSDQVLNITVVDTANNTNTTSITSPGITFTIDDDAPIINVTLPTNNQIITNANGNVTFNYSVTEANISLSNFSVDSGQWVLTTTANATNITIYNISGGTHTVVFNVKDEASNLATQVSRTFRVIGQENITERANSIETGNTGVVNVSIKNSSGTELSGVAWMNNSVSMEFEVNASTTDNYSVTMPSFNSSLANWNRTDFTIVVSKHSLPANLSKNKSGTNFTKLVLFQNMSSFLNDTYYNTTTIVFNETLKDFEVMYVDDDLGHNVYKLAQCTGNTAPSTVGNITAACYTNGSLNVTTYVPHLSGAGLANDTVAPTINITGPTNNTNQSADSFVQVSADVWEANPNTTFCRYNITNATGNVQSGTINTTNFTNVGVRYTHMHNYSDLLNGTYNYTLNCTDQNQRSSISSPRNFSIKDGTIPIITDLNYTASGTGTSTVILILNVTTNEHANCAYNTSNLYYGNMTAFSTTGTLSHTTNFSFTTDNTGTLFVRCSDKNSNVMTYSNSTNYTTDVAGSTSTSTSTSSSSSSSSGDGFVIEEPTIKGEKSTQLWTSIKASDTLEMSPDKEEIPITKLEATTKNKLKNVQISVIELTQAPETRRKIKTLVYKYAQVSRTKNLVDGVIENAEIQFKVSKEWLEKNKVNKTDIVLKRYKNSKWNNLPTKIISENNNYTIYKATTPGFSYFAIATTKIIEKEAEENQTALPEEEIEEETLEEEEEEFEKLDLEAMLLSVFTSPEKPSIWTLIITSIIVLTYLTIELSKGKTTKKKKKKKSKKQKKNKHKKHSQKTKVSKKKKHKHKTKKKLSKKGLEKLKTFQKKPKKRNKKRKHKKHNKKIRKNAKKKH